MSIIVVYPARSHEHALRKSEKCSSDKKKYIIRTIYVLFVNVNLYFDFISYILHVGMFHRLEIHVHYMNMITYKYFLKMFETYNLILSTNCQKSLLIKKIDCIFSSIVFTS